MILEVVQSLFISAQHLFVLMSVYVLFYWQFIKIFMLRFYDFLKLFGKVLINTLFQRSHIRVNSLMSIKLKLICKFYF